MNKIIRLLMVFVGISGCFSVLFGAWLAHAGQGLTERTQLSLDTALQYQLFHTLALFGCIILAKIQPPSRLLLAACIGYVLGILCFSGTIYLKSFFELPLLAKLTPFGGISFALAWLLLAFEGKNTL
tara:strand:- start:289 stop:669 length:381 start_codon:yes stop_codon:yes gene_type:complete